MEQNNNITSNNIINKNENVAQKIALLLSIIIIIGIAVSKLIYYIPKFSNGYFRDNFVLGLLWMVISTLISSIPLILIVIALKSKRKHLAMLIIATVLIVCSLIFEGISLIGATMSLDEEWFNIGVGMARCHLISIIPAILSFVACKK